MVKIFFKSNGRWNIGNGAKVSIAEDKRLASEEKAGVKEGYNFTKVLELTHPTSHSWKVDILRGDMQPHSAIEALKTPIRWSDTPDILIWSLTKDENYNAKSRYACIMEGCVKSNPKPSSSYIHSEVS